ncbi:MAG: right-handed parallel beta-helix repeat-containing protein, partial [Armatimonadota bacterium]|nr:right-handed parallel beta-helix repeat-containing protein [Armatimonadota bacterium]
YFHDSGVRVMIQGFKHGLFENNRFERISGGLALTCDAWWFEGPTCQDITVRNNVFQDTAFRNAWGTGKAALTIGAGWSEGHTDASRGCAFHGATVTGNTIIGSSTGAIFISNTDNVN